MGQTKAPKREIVPLWIHVPDPWANYSRSIKLGNVFTQLTKPHTSIIHSVPKRQLDAKPETVPFSKFSHSATDKGSYKVGFWMHLIQHVKLGLNVGRNKDAASGESHDVDSMKMECFLPSGAFLDAVVTAESVASHLKNDHLPENQRHVFLVMGLAAGKGDDATLSGSEESHNEASLDVNVKGLVSAGPSAENTTAGTAKTSYRVETTRLMAYRVMKIGLDLSERVTADAVRGNFYGNETSTKSADVEPDRVFLPLEDSDFEDRNATVTEALDEEGDDCYFVTGVLAETPETQGRE